MSATGFKRLTQLDGSLFESFMMFTAELIGTAILIFVGCIGCVGALSSAPLHMQVALTFGLAITISLTIFGHISGAHINPSVTIAAVILGKTSIPTAGIYIVAQCLGGILGYGLLVLVTPGGYRHSGAESATSNTLCVTLVSHNISSLQGLGVEVLATWILILVCGAVWDSRNENWAGGISIKLGLTVAGLAMAAGSYSGCSMNPARSLGPAVWTNNWTNHWVYWIGPILGAILGGLNYLMYSKMTPGVKENVSTPANP